MGEAFKYAEFQLTPAATPEDMATRIMRLSPASDAEALKLLRASYPHCSLSARVAALDYLMRRKARGAAAALSA